MRSVRAAFVLVLAATTSAAREESPARAASAAPPAGGEEPAANAVRTTPSITGEEAANAARAESSTRTAPSAASAASNGERPALSPLPRPPSLEIPPPTGSSLEALDALLGRLVSRDSGERETAAAEVLEVERDRLPAIHRRLGSIAESSDHVGMKDVLGSIRDKTHEEKKGPPPDYLEMLEAHARPDSKNFRDLVQVVGMGRMLRHVGTVGAARELIGIYARFGEFLRVDVQLSLEKMGEGAIAALIEAERHPAPKIAHWAGRQLDGLGKAIPGEAVRTNDPEVLADVLRAYGRTRDPDAARLVISFANSERTQIREAARQAVVLMGEVANWQLRDTYESVVGKKPSREWSWDRTARELFAEYDRSRLSVVERAFDDGLAAYKAGKLDDMAALFDQVLSQSPVFSRANEMVPGYAAYADAHLDDTPALAERALRRVERLSGDDKAVAKRAESLLLVLSAEELMSRHIADQSLVKHALELDPNDARARRLLDRMGRGEVDANAKSRRYAAAGVIGALALGAMAVILLRRPRSEDPKPDPLGPAPENASAPPGDVLPADPDATHPQTPPSEPPVPDEKKLDDG
ncbi:MAG TPA: hypothetical protein VHU80_01000 [Polyangiaceae bacterium]|jgi:hypothetical protein|nr:hypothetical protein [Polyangiaceae bacterium]